MAQELTPEQRARINEWRRAHRARNAEEEKVKRLAYYQSNKDRINAAKKRYREVNWERLRTATDRRRFASSEKEREKSKAWYAANKEKMKQGYDSRTPEDIKAYRAYQRVYRLKALYGLTPEAFDKMWNAQGKVCLACKEPCEPCVDHDHKTGLVRGIVCHRCNHSLGHARDNPQTLRRLADYLDTHAILT